MGSCFDKESPSLHASKRKYTQQAHYAIKICNILGKVTAVEQVQVTLPRPIQVCSAQEIRLSRLVMDVTTCVLPGFDPRGEATKHCQDGLYWAVERETLLICLFDGHGDTGAEVVEYCIGFVKTYFAENQPAFLVDST